MNQSPNDQHPDLPTNGFWIHAPRRCDPLHSRPCVAAFICVHGKSHKSRFSCHVEVILVVRPLQRSKIYPLPDIVRLLVMFCPVSVHERV